jgi:hypothetical protein
MKAKQPRTLPMTSDVRESLARIVSYLDQAQMTSHFSSFELFNCALGVFDAVLHGVKLNTWMNEVCVGLERSLTPLGRALDELVLQATLNYEDLLGLIYMQMQYGNQRMGQYFTPYVVARAMAEMLIPPLGPSVPGEPPLRILDPCCGSGILLLTAMEVIEREQPARLDDGSVLFYGIDIDATCVRMARLNLDLHRLGHYLRTGKLITAVQSELAQMDATAQGLAPRMSAAEERTGTASIRQATDLTSTEREAVEQLIGGPLPAQLSLPLLEAVEHQPPLPNEPRVKRPAQRVRPTTKRAVREQAKEHRLYVTADPLFPDA